LKVRKSLGAPENMLKKIKHFLQESWIEIVVGLLIVFVMFMYVFYPVLCGGIK